MGYDITPERRCAGRDEGGKKIFERYFILRVREKIQEKENAEDAENAEDEDSVAAVI
jgi:hypothetical protein